MAILEATVRSLSSFALFLLKACCRQSSIFVQEWCSGRRCYERGKRDLLREREVDCTHVATEVGRAVGAVANNPEDCGGARLITFELAAFLGWHSWRDGGKGEGRLVERGLWAGWWGEKCAQVEERTWVFIFI